jgi:hypothetical protein
MHSAKQSRSIREGKKQGDRMSFRKKIAQNVAQPFLCHKQYTTFTVKINSPKIWAPSVILEKLPKSKQSPNGRKFAQSGPLGKKLCI